MFFFNKNTFIEEGTFFFSMFLDTSRLPHWKLLYECQYRKYRPKLFPTIIIVLCLEDRVVETTFPPDELKSDSVNPIKIWIEQQHKIPFKDQLLLYTVTGEILKEDGFIATITGTVWYDTPEICKLELYNLNLFPAFVNLDLGNDNCCKLLLHSLVDLTGGSIKHWIKMNYNIEPQVQVLLHNGKELEDDKVLVESFYGKNEEECQPIQLHVLEKRPDYSEMVSGVEKEEFRILKPIQVVDLDNQPLQMKYFYSTESRIYELKRLIQRTLLVPELSIKLLWNGEVLEDTYKRFMEVLIKLNFTENRIQLCFTDNERDNIIETSLMIKYLKEAYITDEPFNILVLNPNRGEIIFKAQMNSTSNVGNVKSQLCKQYNFDRCDQQLMSGGDILKDDHRISELVDPCFQSAIPLVLIPKATVDDTKYQAFRTSHNLTTLRTVKVTSLEGQVTTFDVGERIVHFVKCLKFQIQKELRVPRHSQTLLFKQKKLDDEQSLLKLYVDVGNFNTDTITVFLVIAPPSNNFVVQVSCRYGNLHVRLVAVSETASISEVKERCLADFAEKGNTQPIPSRYYTCFTYYQNPIDESRMVFELKPEYENAFHFCVYKKVFVTVLSDDSADIELEFPITEPAIQTVSSIRRSLMRRGNDYKGYRLVLDKAIRDKLSSGIKTKLDKVGETTIVFKAVPSKSRCLIS